MSGVYKLAFLGEPGTGKSTCIAALSDQPPVDTEVGCTDDLLALKRTTTVGIDYGELDLGEQGRLLLYGLPGQPRFRFMFEVVRDGLIGAVLLVDAQSRDPARGLDETLSTHAEELRGLPCVVALNKHPSPCESVHRACANTLRAYGLVAPLITVDARRREDMQTVFELLFMQIEVSGRIIGTC